MYCSLTISNMDLTFATNPEDVQSPTFQILVNTPSLSLTPPQTQLSSHFSPHSPQLSRFQVALLLISASFLAAVQAKAVEAPLHLISLEDLSEEDRRQLAALNKEAAARSKRSGGGSGSGEILATIAQALGKSLKRKISQLARSSASASASFSGGLSGGGYGGGHDEHPVVSD